MRSEAKTVAQYLAQLPPDRRAALEGVRKTILANLDADYEEGMGYGMISYHVPLRVYPPGYHCNPSIGLPFAGLASQKNYMSVYLMAATDESGEGRWLRERFAAADKKLDMGKCCIRFRKLEDLPLAVIGEAVRRMPVKKYIAFYERAMSLNRSARGGAERTKVPPRAAPKARPGKPKPSRAKSSRAAR